MDIKPMFNAYPDSLGGKLSDIVKLFSDYNFSKAFSSFYILPSLFKSDLDRGFCVVSYDLNKELADKGYMVIPGRVSRKYFEERFYGVVNETEEKEVQHASE